jgi:hypothetical protein
MNDYLSIMNIYQSDDIPTDDELLLFSESEEEVKEEKPKKPKTISKINI